MVDDYFATLFQSNLQRVPNTCTRQLGEVRRSDELFEFRHRILLLHYRHPTISMVPINRQEPREIPVYCFSNTACYHFCKFLQAFSHLWKTKCCHLLEPTEYIKEISLLLGIKAAPPVGEKRTGGQEHGNRKTCRQMQLDKSHRCHDQGSFDRSCG